MQNLFEMGVKVSFITFVFQYAYAPVSFDLDLVSE